MSLLTALARLDVDAWEEAAKLARLPLESATQRLASLLATLPNGPVAVESVVIATRLVPLLHRPPKRQARPAASPPLQAPVAPRGAEGAEPGFVTAMRNFSAGLAPGGQGFIPAISDAIKGAQTGERTDRQGIAMREQAENAKLAAQYFHSQGDTPQNAIAKGVIAARNPEIMKELFSRYKNVEERAANSPGGGGKGDPKGDIEKAAQDLRDGNADKDTLDRTRAAFDHLFKNGRALSALDRENSIAAAVCIGPEGKRRTNVTQP